jgi:hypothetical protein
MSIFKRKPEIEVRTLIIDLPYDTLQEMINGASLSITFRENTALIHINLINSGHYQTGHYQNGPLLVTSSVGYEYEY